MCGFSCKYYNKFIFSSACEQLGTIVEGHVILESVAYAL